MLYNFRINLINQSMIDTFGGKQERRKMSEMEQRQKVEGITNGLQQSLLLYLRQPKADPEILDNVQYILANLFNALMYAGDQASGKSRQDDLDAVMRGVGMVLDPARERRRDLDSTAEPTARRFMELVKSRFSELK